MLFSALSFLLLGNLFPVCQEPLDPDICQWVLGKLFNHLIGDVATSARSRLPQHMDRITNAGDDHLRIKIIVLENRDDLFNQFHARLRDIVQPSDKRADIGCPRLGGQKCLRR